jgi:hypothetical protein
MKENLTVEQLYDKLHDYIVQDIDGDFDAKSKAVNLINDYVEQEHTVLQNKVDDASHHCQDMMIGLTSEFKDKFIEFENKLAKVKRDFKSELGEVESLLQECRDGFVLTNLIDKSSLSGNMIDKLEVWLNKIPDERN